jgi:hypothetical protein
VKGSVKIFTRAPGFALKSMFKHFEFS